MVAAQDRQHQLMIDEALLIVQDASRHKELYTGSFASEFQSAAHRNDVDFYNQLKDEMMFKRAAARINGEKFTPMLMEDAARIQSAEARKNGGKIQRGGRAA